MKFKVIIHCQGKEHKCQFGMAMANKCTSCLQTFMAMRITCCKFKLKVILSWQLNVEVYLRRHYTCDRHMFIKYIVNNFRIYPFAVCVHYHCHMLVNDLKQCYIETMSFLQKRICVNEETSCRYWSSAVTIYINWQTSPCLPIGWDCIQLGTQLVKTVREWKHSSLNIMN